MRKNAPKTTKAASDFTIFTYDDQDAFQKLMEKGHNLGVFTEHTVKLGGKPNMWFNPIVTMTEGMTAKAFDGSAVVGYVLEGMADDLLTDSSYMEARPCHLGKGKQSQNVIARYDNPVHKMNRITVNGGFPVGVKKADVQPGTLVGIKWIDGQNTVGLVLEREPSGKYTDFKVLHFAGYTKPTRRGGVPKPGRPIYNVVSIQQDQLAVVLKGHHTGAFDHMMQTAEDAMFNS